MNIKHIKIAGFKSIADIELNDVTPYSVFAGANGAGKSNFFDALKFVSWVVRFGAIEALRQVGGYEQAHCFKNRGKKARMFSASFDLEINGNSIQYELTVHDMDQEPKLEEQLSINNDKITMSRKKNEIPIFRIVNNKSQVINLSPPFVPPIQANFIADMSGLMILAETNLYSLLCNIAVFRFDPNGIKDPNSFSSNAHELEANGRNLATILTALEKDAELREQILEYMELLVQSLEKVSGERRRIDGQTLLRFKEVGIKTQFPANLISDGTIYALCIMTAVLSRSKKAGMTLIEEPERGIHPQAITELCHLMRNHATSQHPIFVTTHSESVVRAAKPEELWLVNKIDGKSEFKNAARSASDLGELNLDKAWLMNFFDGGLPW